MPTNPKITKLDLTSDPANASNLTTTPVTPGAPATTPNDLVTTAVSAGTTQLTDTTGASHFSFSSGGDASLAGSLSLNNATLQGGMSVSGDSTFKGLSNFQKLATFFGKTIFRQDIQIDGHVTVASDSAGYAGLRKGESTVHVTFKAAYDKPPVVSASVSNGQFVLSSINNVTSQGFDISVQNPAAADTSFDWTAVGVTSPQTATNPLSASVAPTTATN